MRLSPATVAIGQAAAQGGFAVVAFDAYRRDYATDLATRVVQPLPQQVLRAFDGLARRMERLERALPGGGRLSVRGVESFSLTGRDGAGEFAFGAGAQAREWFGIGAAVDVAALGNPYAAIGPRGALVGRGLSFGETTVKAGLLGGTATESSGSGWSFVDARTSLLEVRHAFGRDVALTATWARALEQGAWLGAVGTGAFASTDTVRTDSLQFGASWTVFPGATIAGTFAQGRTPAHRGAGLIGSVSASRSDAASIALLLSHLVVAEDALSLSLSQPMRARSGEAVGIVQTGVDADGAPSTEVRTIGLVPAGRERIVELGWRAPAGRDASVGAVLAVRLQPNHDATSTPDTLVALRYRLAF
jgi:hypothetical protein